MSAPKIIYITPAPEGGFVEFWAEHPSAARGDVAYIPQKGATKMQAEIDALKAELAELKAPPKVLSAEDVEKEGWYWSVDNEEFVQIDCDPTILPWQLSMWRVSSSVCSRLQGQFIGPIKMPEV